MFNYFCISFVNEENMFFICNPNTEINGGRLRSFYNMKIFVIRGWGPRATRPVPNKCFLSCFSCNIP